MGNDMETNGNQHRADGKPKLTRAVPTNNSLNQFGGLLNQEANMKAFLDMCGKGNATVTNVGKAQALLEKKADLLTKFSSSASQEEPAVLGEASSQCTRLQVYPLCFLCLVFFCT
jgi:hypothetical protein